MGAGPCVSVVIPTYNRLERLQLVLSALMSQSFDGEMEIIVVSDGSTDGTDEYLRGSDVPDLVVAVFQENAGPAAARNAGAAAARGELVVFVDDDVVAAPGLVSAHVDAHRRAGDRAVVIGPMLDPPDFEMTPWVAWEQRKLAVQYDDMELGRYTATPRQFYTGNASLQRRHLLTSGGFDVRFRRAEDVELAFRLDDAGLRFVFEPTALGHHYAARSYESWKSNAYDYGRNDVVFGRDLGRSWILPFLAEKQRRRPAIARAVARASAVRPWVAKPFIRVLETLFINSVGARFVTVNSAALSMIYSVEYDRGILDEAGGVDEFRRLVAAVGDEGRR